MNKALQTIAVSLFLIITIGCGGNDSNNTSAIEENTSNLDSKVTEDLNPLNESEDLEEELVTELDLDKALSSSQLTDIVAANIEGKLPEVEKNMWSSIVPLTKDTKEYFVSPNGLTTNLGTQLSPWDFYSVARGEHSISGDSIVWMMMGKYKNPESSAIAVKAFDILLSGDVDKPIHFRPYAASITQENPSVLIDGGIRMTGSWIWLWELEMSWVEEVGEPIRYDKNGQKVADWRPQDHESLGAYFDSNGIPDSANMRPDITITDYSSHSKIINCISHKNVQGFASWSPVSNFELHGSIFYNNGWNDNNGAHGHGMYIQNATGTQRLISDNIIAGNYGHAAQIYSSSGQIERATNDISFIGNVWYGARKDGKDLNSIIVGFDQSSNVKFSENFVHGKVIEMPYLADADYVPRTDHECKNNHLYRTALGTGRDCTEAGNFYTSKSEDYTTIPATATIRPNKYDARRANIIIFNPKREDTLSISLGAFAQKGDKVIILNPFRMTKEPVAYGTYNGDYANITFPDTDWEYEIYRTYGISEIHKEFAAFVLINLGQ